MAWHFVWVHFCPLQFRKCWGPRFTLPGDTKLRIGTPVTSRLPPIFRMRRLVTPLTIIIAQTAEEIIPVKRQTKLPRYIMSIPGKRYSICCLHLGFRENTSLNSQTYLKKVSTNPVRLSEPPASKNIKKVCAIRLPSRRVKCTLNYEDSPSL